MTSAIDFLARMGADATLRYAPPAEVERAARSANVDASVRAAIATGDVQQLSDLLGARKSVCCIVAVPEDSEEGDEEDDKEDKADVYE